MTAPPTVTTERPGREPGTVRAFGLTLSPAQAEALAEDLKRAAWNARRPLASEAQRTAMRAFLAGEYPAHAQAGVFTAASPDFLMAQINDRYTGGIRRFLADHPDA